MEIEETIKKCLNGDQGAWKMIVNAYSQKIFSMSYQFTGSHQEAEDLTQEIFFKLYSSLKKYDFRKNFSAWLLTLAKNHLIDNYRRTKWEKKNRDELDERFFESAESEKPEHKLEQQETQKTIWKGLNQLSPDIRLALILFDIQGKTYEETAEILAVPVGTIKSRINRGRLQLTQILRGTREVCHDL
ncbi:MAG: RNA polymerase sigma factor [Acidobacteriota bacterium]